MKHIVPKTQPPYPGTPAHPFDGPCAHRGKTDTEQHPSGAIIFWSTKCRVPLPSHSYYYKVLVRCVRCQKEFWKGVQHITDTFTGGCLDCYQKIGKDRHRHNRNFKGRITMKDGYIYAHIDTFSPEEQIILRPMLHRRQHSLSNYVLEHRAIMALHLGCPLKGHQESIHHLNGIKHDNRLENLEIVTPNDHPHYNAKKASARIRDLEAKVKRLQKLLTSHEIDW